MKFRFSTLGQRYWSLKRITPPSQRGRVLRSRVTEDGRPRANNADERKRSFNSFPSAGQPPVCMLGWRDGRDKPLVVSVDMRDAPWIPCDDPWGCPDIRHLGPRHSLRRAKRGSRGKPGRHSFLWLSQRIRLWSISGEFRMRILRLRKQSNSLPRPTRLRKFRASMPGLWI